MCSSDLAGHVINIGSISAEHLNPGGEIYTATKAGVRAFSETLRKGVEQRGIKVSLIEPGRTGRLTYPAVETDHILIIEGILQRQHRHDMPDLTEGTDRSATHALSRGCGIGPFGMRRLECRQLMEEAVVLGVGDQGRIEHIVGMVMALELPAQRVDCRTGLR